MESRISILGGWPWILISRFFFRVVGCSAMGMGLALLSSPTEVLALFYQPLSVSLSAVPCTLRDLGSLTRGWIMPSAVAAWSLNHWTTTWNFPLSISCCNKTPVCPRHHAHSIPTSQEEKIIRKAEKTEIQKLSQNAIANKWWSQLQKLVSRIFCRMMEWRCFLVFFSIYYPVSPIIINKRTRNRELWSIWNPEKWVMALPRGWSSKLSGCKVCESIRMSVRSGLHVALLLAFVMQNTGKTQIWIAQEPQNAPWGVQ